MKLLMEGWRDYLGLGKEAEPEEVPEPEEEEDEQSAQEADIARLLFHDDEAYRNMATDLFGSMASSDDPKYKLDLDLLATELDDRLRAEWEALPHEPRLRIDQISTREEMDTIIRHSEAWDAWIPRLELVVKFITGGDSTQGFRPSAKAYKLGSLKDTFARHLKMTARAMKSPSPDTSDESLMENWRKYLKDHDLDELPFGPTTGPMARSGPESYKFKSPEERWEYTKWKYPKAKRHKLNITYEDLLHAIAIGGRPLADYADESAADWEARRAKEAEEAGLPHPWAKEAEESDETST